MLSVVNGCIKAGMPSTIRMLKMLLPSTLPRANWALPRRAAMMQVMSSGSDVPSATMVIEITVSLMPQARAIACA